MNRAALEIGPSRRASAVPTSTAPATAALAAALALGALLPALALLPGCRKDGPKPQIEAEDIQVRLGLAGVIDRSRWNILRIQARNRGADFQGTLEIQGITDTFEGERTEPLTYRMDLDIPGKGTTVREVSIPVCPQEWQKVRVALAAPGWSRSFKNDLPPDDDARARILLVGDRIPDPATLLEELKPPASPPGQKDGNGEKEAVPKPSPNTLVIERPIGSARLPVSDLPSLPLAYDPFQIVVLWGTALQDAPTEAIGALAEWVRSGGTLLAFPGESWAGGLPPKLLDLLNVALGDPQELPGDDVLRRIGPAASDGLWRRILPGPLAEEIAGGIAVRSAAGAGMVTTLSFRPGGREFPSPSRAPGIFEALRPALARAASFAGNWGAGLGAMEQVTALDLYGLSGFGVPKIPTVLFGLVIYLVAGLIVPYFIFKRRGRREWTFPVIILAAAAAVFAIYRWGLLSSMKTGEVEEIAVLRIHADGKAAEATSFLGFISPSLGRLDLEKDFLRPGDAEAIRDARIQPIRGFLEQYWRGQRKIPQPHMDIQADPAGRFHLPPMTLYPNGMRFLRVDSRVSLEDRIEMRYEGGESPKVVVKSRIPEALSWSYLEGNQYSLPVPISRPGNDLEFPIPPKEALSGLKDRNEYDGNYYGNRGGVFFSGPAPTVAEAPSSFRITSFLGFLADPERGPPSPQGAGFMGTLGVTQKPKVSSGPKARYLVALSRSPLFPEVKSLPGRKSYVLYVLELPPTVPER